MILNAHSYYSLRYGTLSLEDLTDLALHYGYDTFSLTDINNTTGALDFVKLCNEKGIKPIVGAEIRNDNELLYVLLARNAKGFREINELITESNLNSLPYQFPAPEFANCYVVYPYAKRAYNLLKDYEYIGITKKQLTKIIFEPKEQYSKYVIFQSVCFKDKAGYELHLQLRAVDNNLLITQLSAEQTATKEEHLRRHDELLSYFKDFPQLIRNTRNLSDSCNFEFDFKAIKNKKYFTGSAYDDRELLLKLALDGLEYRYGKNNKTARERVLKELDIIDKLGFSSYFLITNDIIRYSMQRGFYHVGRGSGANSVVAYCLRITDVCPIELDLYFERFLNPKRKSPPDFDIDYSWRERDEVLNYIFKRYGRKHTALLGAMSTFKDRSSIRELGKVMGLPKAEIDQLIQNPFAPINQHNMSESLFKLCRLMNEFPNQRTIHAGGVLISEEPITSYTALDLPPKGFPTSQIDMYIAEDIGFEKLDILSQRGIGHIKECAEIVYKNRGIKIDVHDINNFKKDKKIQGQLKSGDTIGCFYVESPAMRGLLKKLKCEDYLTLVAASSIIRPGVAKSGMMKEYIYRFHNPDKFTYPHPIMQEQLKETRGVMVYQEDVLKVGHYFGGLDLADADVLRRMMSGKTRNKKHLQEIEEKYYQHCKSMNYPETLSKEIWRQIESFAGYSFSKAHSASYAVESFQSLYLKTYFPLEFMVAVINNFGGFYSTRVYLEEARKAGATVHLPCVNSGQYYTSIVGKDVYLGWVHVKSLEAELIQNCLVERDKQGEFKSLEDFIRRTSISTEQLISMIRINGFRFTNKSKSALLWEAHSVLNAHKKKPKGNLLFDEKKVEYKLPEFSHNLIADLYDELELLEFTVSGSAFDLLKTTYKAEVMAKDLMQYVGKKVKMMGNYVTTKLVRTVKGETMCFGTFLDQEKHFFDTVHFPPSLKQFPYNGAGIYLIYGKVVEEFGFPSIEVEKFAKLAIQPDSRGN